MSDDRTHIVSRPSAVEVGTELNETYRIDALIAAGGMGEVFKGHNIQTGDPVAIKVVLPEFARDGMIFDLFRKEARVLNHLSHDAIVRYYVFSLDRVLGRPYLAMEFVDGPSLAAHMKTAPLPPADFFGLLRRLADGLHKAHEAGVIHRDISPDNVILPNGLVENAKIIDFGIARSASVGGATLLGGSFAGKYSYVSPEQLGLFSGEVTPKSDIYSLGLTMAAALRGRPLDMSGSQVDVIEKRRSVPDLAAAGIPKQLQPILSAMLQPDPANRPASMAEVRDRVDEEKAKAGQKDAKPARFRQAQVGQGKVPATGNASTPAPQPGTALPAATFIIGLLAVIVVGGLGGWIYVQSQKKPPSVQTAAATPSTAPVSAEPGREISNPAVPAQPPPTNIADQPAPAQVAPATAAETPTPAVQAGSSEPAGGPAPVTPPPASVGAQSNTSAQSLGTPAPKFDVAALTHFASTYGDDKCFKADTISLSESTARLAALGTEEERSNFARAFAQQAGFEPQITFNPVTSNQCGFVASLSKLPAHSGSPLQVTLDRGEMRGNQADQSSMGDALNVSVMGAGDRNVYLYVIDYEGGVQAINRACPNCIKMKPGEITASLSLSKPDDSAPAGLDFFPVLIFAAASTKPLNGINAQDAYDAGDFVKALLQDSAASGDFSSSVGYVKLKKE